MHLNHWKFNSCLLLLLLLFIKRPQKWISVFSRASRWAPEVKGHPAARLSLTCGRLCVGRGSSSTAARAGRSARRRPGFLPRSHPSAGWALKDETHGILWVRHIGRAALTANLACRATDVFFSFIFFFIFIGVMSSSDNKDRAQR